MLFALTLISNSGMLDFGNTNDLMLVIIKYGFIIAGVFYLIFAYLVIRQIDIMSKTVGTTISSKNKTLGIVHFVISLLVLIYFLLVL